MHPQERRGLPLKAAERHELRRRSFDAAARLYDTFRPGYPEPLFDDLVRLSGIPGGGRILEIGPGTGQATLPLARRGFSIVGIEMGASMARLCRKNLRGFPNVEILNVAFEDWTGDTSATRRAETGTTRGKQGLSRAARSYGAPGTFDASAPRDCPSFSALPGTVPASAPRGISRRSVDVSPSETFDLVFAATAFHWVASKAAFTRCAKVLKPHGSLALCWNFADIPENRDATAASRTQPLRGSVPHFPGPVPALPDPRFYNDLRAIYRRIAPHMHLSLPPELRIERQRKKIVSSGLFGPVTVLRYPWQSEYTADRYIGLLKTMSDHAILAPEVRRDILRAVRRLIAENGGSFIRPVMAVLFLAPKRPPR
jgi:SAM-dependent methyltransferase